MDQNTYPTIVTATTTDGATTGYEFYGQRIDPSASASVWHQPAAAPVPAVRTAPSQQVTAPAQSWQHGLPIEHPSNVAGLVCGIIGLIGVPPLGIVALVLGIRANKDIQRYPMKYQGQGTATANIVLGSLSAIFTLLMMLFFLMMIMSAAMY